MRSNCCRRVLRTEVGHINPYSSATAVELGVTAVELGVRSDCCRRVLKTEVGHINSYSSATAVELGVRSDCCRRVLKTVVGHINSYSSVNNDSCHSSFGVIPIHILQTFAIEIKFSCKLSCKCESSQYTHHHWHLK